MYSFRCRELELDGTIYLLRKDICCKLNTLFRGRCFQVSWWLNVLSFCSNICSFDASWSPNGCSPTDSKSSHGLLQVTKYRVRPDGKRKEHAFSFHPGTRIFPRSPFALHLFGQKGVSWTPSCKGGQTKEHLAFSAAVLGGGQGESKRNHRPKCLSRINQFRFFLPLYPIHRNHCLPSASQPWKRALTNLPPDS